MSSDETTALTPEQRAHMLRILDSAGSEHSDIFVIRTDASLTQKVGLFYELAGTSNLPVALLNAAIVFLHEIVSAPASCECGHCANARASARQALEAFAVREQATRH